ncbi:LVIVD repeat-containing protein [Halobium salinum]|uniref:LVIVD repeat-containing protein n=1 Tax=Halobium salinum TaxID=1364940 RepID=A0ABD5PBU2_9EURY|nr:hypothetical protein [Halobium salinum]
MRRRDVLRAGAAALGAGVLGTSRVGAHPGFYRPYAELPLEGAKEAVVSDDGGTAFVATTTGYATVDVSTYDSPSVLADRRNPLADRENGPLRGIYDVKQEGDTLLVVGPANPLGDALHGLLVVDVSDPANPEERAFFETDYPIHNCFLRDGYAYLTGNDGERNPVVVVDVSGSESESASEPTEVARWSIADHDEAWLEVPSGVRPVHDVWVQGGVAYLVCWDTGTWLLDVSDPTNPTYLTDFRGQPLSELRAIESRGAARRTGLTPPGNDHFVALNEDGSLLGVGMESWAMETEEGIVGGPSGIDLYDLSDRTNPERVATIEPPRTDRPTMEGVWTTSHNFEFRDGTLYTSWYQGGVKLYDVSDPANPQEFAWWRDPDEARFWTARAAVPGESYVASDMGSDYAGSDASLYVFPDHAGDQRDPPSLTSGNGSVGRAGGNTSATTTDDGIVTATPTPGTNGSGDGTADAGSETGETADDGGSAGTTAGDGRSETSAPGFGAGAALTALGLGAWQYRRRARGREAERDE